MPVNKLYDNKKKPVKTVSSVRELNSFDFFLIRNSYFYTNTATYINFNTQLTLRYIYWQNLENTATFHYLQYL